MTRVNRCLACGDEFDDIEDLKEHRVSCQRDLGEAWNVQRQVSGL